MKWKAYALIFVYSHLIFCNKLFTTGTNTLKKKITGFYLSAKKLKAHNVRQRE